jgi:hypothetical protein
MSGMTHGPFHKYDVAKEEYDNFIRDNPIEAKRLSDELSKKAEEYKKAKEIKEKEEDMKRVEENTRRAEEKRRIDIEQQKEAIRKQQEYERIHGFGSWQQKLRKDAEERSEWLKKLEQEEKKRLQNLSDYDTGNPYDRP